uniref:Uncharacterized protein n=1 Tax=Trieres chinensis TaxID=1514140 RepID=A0A7S1ZMY6_TRICV|mmetsp:Transcript_28818/g.59007  ORF Transcript_28818/g.59007 Transcript_28818/m.59007 type:complete len:397 (+) Transcript_28818:197-1387(+)
MHPAPPTPLLSQLSHGSAAAVQTKKCKSHGVSKCVADPSTLFRVRCTRCDFARDYAPNGAGAAKYLYYRRRTRSTLGLLSVGAPLDPASAAFLCRAASECGVISNTAQPHVSFSEGLVPDLDHGPGVRALRAALSFDPTLTVVGFHRVPRRDNVTDLIIADVLLSPGADMAARQLSGDAKTCALPQFPFHVALGACPRAGGGSKRASAWAEASLKGAVLAVDPRRVRVLPPPEGGKRAKPQYSQPSWKNQNKLPLQQPAQYDHHGHRTLHVPRLSTLNSMIPSPGRGYGQEHFGHENENTRPSQVTTYSTPKEEPFISHLSDDTDTASTSSSSEAAVPQFPGLAVDLTFLDEQEEAARPLVMGTQTFSSRVPANPWQHQHASTFVQPIPTSTRART